MKGVLASLLLALCAFPVLGDDWFGAQAVELRSPSGRYAARIEPGSGDAFKFEDTPKKGNAQVFLAGPEGEAHAFFLLNPCAPVDAALLDDGSLVAFDNWHTMGYGPVIALYSVEGVVRWSRELEALLPEDVLTRVPMTVSSRWWRKSPLEWKPMQDEAGENFGLVTLWNEDRLEIRLSDGAVEYVKVDDLGDDAEKLLRRGKDLVEKGEFVRATETLSRAISLKPDLIDAYRELAWLYLRQEKGDAAVRILQEGIEKNPPTEVKPSTDGVAQNDPKMWLLFELARTYESVERRREAEAVYWDCLRLDPGYWQAGEGLARLLLKSSRRAEADRLLAGFFEILRGDSEATLASWRLSDAVEEIGSVYDGEGLYAQAKKYYLLGYDAKASPLFLAFRLAAVHEKLGEHKEALAVLEASRAWLSTQSSAYESDRKKVQDDIARVTEKLKAVEAEKRAVDKRQGPARGPQAEPPRR